MKILLDTQVFIWLTNESEKIGATTRRMLEDTTNQLYLSYFSCFEMTIKASIGKLDYDPSVIDDLTKMGIELIMPSVSVLQTYKVYNTYNKDPFDNMLISIAIKEKSALMTSDRKILAASSPGLKTIEAMK